MAYKQAQIRKRKLRKTYEQTKNSYGSGVWFDVKRGFYYKYTASNTPGYTKSLRRLGNKRVRKTRGSIASGSSYKKIFDYKWTLF